MTNIILGAVALGLLWAMMTMGVFITYRILDIADLTVEGSIVLGAATAAMAISEGMHPLTATVLSLGTGMLAGLLTGILHAGLKIPPLLSGILSMIALYSINIRVMKGSANISLLQMDTIYTPLTAAGFNQSIAVIIVGLICCLLAVLVLFWFFHTEIGCSVRATGDNLHMAHAQGINTNVAKVLGLVISNGLVGLSGGLIAQYQGFSDVQMGTGSIVIGLASLIIGEVLLGRRGLLGKLLSLLFGAVIYRIIIAMVLKLGMQATDLKLFTALTVAIALYLPHLKALIVSKFNIKTKGDRYAGSK